MFLRNSPFESKAKELTAKEKPSTIPDETHVYSQADATTVTYEVLTNWYERLNDRIHQDGNDGELEDLRDDIYSYLRG
jgi:hypothetical protein